MSALRIRIAVGLAALAAVLPVRGAGDKPKNPLPVEEWKLHSVLPLGDEYFRLEPVGARLVLTVSAASPEFEGWRRMRQGTRQFLLDAGGAAVRHFPGAVDFRVTATTLPGRRMVYEKPTILRTGAGMDPNQLVFGLHFRLKIFRGLEAHEIEPAAVSHPGAPQPVPSPEHTYLVSFNLQDVPADDRLMLEVFTPDGERVSRFHLELL